MILQELLRNIVLYRGVFTPLFISWKEYLLSASLGKYKFLEDASALQPFTKPFQTLFLPIAKNTMSQKNVLSFLKERVETHTITFAKAFSIEYLPSETIITAMKLAMDSNSFISVLMGSSDGKYAVTTTKTEVSLFGSSSNITTGFVFEKIGSFLFHETHERREYLGEFSLLHEEIHLLYPKGRR